MGDLVQFWKGLGFLCVGCLGLGYFIQLDFNQKIFENSKSFNVVYLRVGSKFFLCLVFGFIGVVSIVFFVLGMVLDLFQIFIKELDCFIQDYLKLSFQFQEQVKKVIDIILCCFYENCVYKVLRVSKGGLFGWGIDLRDGCDVEFIIFFNCFMDYKDQGFCCVEIFDEM